MDLLARLFYVKEIKLESFCDHAEIPAENLNSVAHRLPRALMSLLYPTNGSALNQREYGALVF